ncbi:MAG: hypothetical protein JRI56_08935 [Deltaproteobacteria bacterium]|nr:hypothetical protein [Deltaproteobacteria bacterium]
MKKIGNPFIVGIEKFKPYYERQKKLNIYDEVYCTDIMDFILNEKYDLIICSELIEHLEKAESIKLIERLENYFNKLLIITTPLGFMKTKGYDKNKYQIHKSGYKINDFRKRGFKTRIVQMQQLPRSIKLIHWIYKRALRRFPQEVIVAYKWNE